MKYEAYRAAIDEGTAELSEIVGKIQQLHLRETLIEKTVEGLKALVALETEDVSKDEHPKDERPKYGSFDTIQDPLASPSSPTQQSADSTHYLYEKSASESRDPLQWRIDNALSEGFANRRRSGT